jgi:hypothetical protein
MVYSWPDLKLCFAPLDPGNEVYDAQFHPTNGSSLVAITAKKCMILSLGSGKVEWMNETPSPASVPCEFRAARYILYQQRLSHTANLNFLDSALVRQRMFSLL